MNDGALELERIRQENGWTQKELAAHVKLDEPLISRLLHGRRSPNLKQAVAIQKRLGVDAALWFSFRRVRRGRAA